MVFILVVEEVFDKGILVIMVDCRIFFDKYIVYIGVDNYELGKVVGNYIVYCLKGCGKVVELSGFVGFIFVIECYQGFMSVIS